MLLLSYSMRTFACKSSENTIKKLAPEILKRPREANGNERIVDSGRPADVAGQGEGLQLCPVNLATSAQTDPTDKYKKTTENTQATHRPLTKDGLRRASRNQSKNCSTDRAANFDQFLKP
jgi:hypothetical protein